MRNMEKTTAKIRGQFNSRTGLDRYDMDGEEMLQLVRQCQEGHDFEALSTAFLYGFVLGHRATVAGKIKDTL